MAVSVNKGEGQNRVGPDGLHRLRPCFTGLMTASLVIAAFAAGTVYLYHLEGAKLSGGFTDESSQPDSMKRNLAENTTEQGASSTATTLDRNQAGEERGIFCCKGESCMIKHKPRVRREWRKLSGEARIRVAEAFWTLKNTSTEKGRSRYGPHFQNYDELVMLHACAVRDPRCDQGHAGPQFMTFHRLLLLKVEMALLSVAPDIEAMPYWDMAKDGVNGEYRHDPDKYIFTDKYFGNFFGNASNAYAVESGLFAHWPINTWTSERFGSNSPIADESFCIEHEFFKGYIATTCSRCCGKGLSCSCTDADEFPTFLRDSDVCSPTLARNPAEGPNSVKLGGTYELVYREQDFLACEKFPNNVRTWMDWQNCQTLGYFFCHSSPAQLATNKKFIKVLRDEILPDLLSKVNGDKEHLYSILNPQLQSIGIGGDQFLKPGKSDSEILKVVAGILSTAMYRLNSTLLNHVSDAIESLCKEPMIYGYFKNAHENKREFPYFHHGHGHFKLGLDFLDVTTSMNDPGAFSGHHTNIDRSSMGFMMNSLKEDPGLEEKLWYYPKTQSDLTGHGGMPPYGLSGPFGIGALLTCHPKSEDYPFYRFGSQPWTSGTLADDVVSSGYAIVDIFNASCVAGDDCSGRSTGGYTHRDVIYFTSPQRTPYTYDTLEHFYDFHDECEIE